MMPSRVSSLSNLHNQSSINLPSLDKSFADIRNEWVKQRENSIVSPHQYCKDLQQQYMQEMLQKFAVKDRPAMLQMVLAFFKAAPGPEEVIQKIGEQNYFNFLMCAWHLASENERVNLNQTIHGIDSNDFLVRLQEMAKKKPALLAQYRKAGVAFIPKDLHASFGARNTRAAKGQVTSAKSAELKVDNKAALSNLRPALVGSALLGLVGLTAITRGYVNTTQNPAASKAPSQPDILNNQTVSGVIKMESGSAYNDCITNAASTLGNNTILNDEITSLFPVAPIVLKDTEGFFNFMGQAFDDSQLIVEESSLYGDNQTATFTNANIRVTTEDACDNDTNTGFSTQISTEEVSTSEDVSRKSSDAEEFQKLTFPPIEIGTLKNDAIQANALLGLKGQRNFNLGAPTTFASPSASFATAIYDLVFGNQPQDPFVLEPGTYCPVVNTTYSSNLTCIRTMDTFEVIEKYFQAVWSAGQEVCASDKYCQPQICYIASSAKPINDASHRLIKSIVSLAPFLIASVATRYNAITDTYKKLKTQAECSQPILSRDVPDSVTETAAHLAILVGNIATVALLSPSKGVRGAFDLGGHLTYALPLATATIVPLLKAKSIKAKILGASLIISPIVLLTNSIFCGYHSVYESVVGSAMGLTTIAALYSQNKKILEIRQTLGRKLITLPFEMQRLIGLSHRDAKAQKIVKESAFGDAIARGVKDQLDLKANEVKIEKKKLQGMEAGFAAQYPKASLDKTGLLNSRYKNRQNLPEAKFDSQISELETTVAELTQKVEPAKKSLEAVEDEVKALMGDLNTASAAYETARTSFENFQKKVKEKVASASAVASHSGERDKQNSAEKSITDKHLTESNQLQNAVQAAKITRDTVQGNLTSAQTRHGACSSKYAYVKIPCDNAKRDLARAKISRQEELVRQLETTHAALVKQCSGPLDDAAQIAAEVNQLQKQTSDVAKQIPRILQKLVSYLQPRIVTITAETTLEAKIKANEKSLLQLAEDAGVPMLPAFRSSTSSTSASSTHSAINSSSWNSSSSSSSALNVLDPDDVLIRQPEPSTSRRKPAGAIEQPEIKESGSIPNSSTASSSSTTSGDIWYDYANVMIGRLSELSDKEEIGRSQYLIAESFLKSKVPGSKELRIAYLRNANANGHKGALTDLKREGHQS